MDIIRDLPRLPIYMIYMRHKKPFEKSFRIQAFAKLGHLDFFSNRLANMGPYKDLSEVSHILCQGSFQVQKKIIS